MRGLISTALVLAPALTSALRVREVGFDHERVGEVAAIGIHPIYFSWRMPRLTLINSRPFIHPDQCRYSGWFKVT
jgi:hypothetical protein